MPAFDTYFENYADEERDRNFYRESKNPQDESVPLNNENEPKVKSLKEQCIVIKMLYKGSKIYASNCDTIKNFYVHNGKDRIPFNMGKIEPKKLGEKVELLLHSESRKPTNDVFRIVDTDIIFAVDGFKNMSENEEEIVIYMESKEEISTAGRMLRINKETYEMELSDVYTKVQED